jgi:hypothetical protein
VKQKSQKERSMKTHSPISRKNFITFSAATLFAITLGCATKKQAPVIYIDESKVKNLSDLVREITNAIKQAGGPSVTKEDIYKKLAEAFVEYAHEAIALGIPIPESIKNRLPPKKKTTLSGGIVTINFGNIVITILIALLYRLIIEAMFELIKPIMDYIDIKVRGEANI